MRREILKKLKYFTIKGYIFLKIKFIDYFFIFVVGILSYFVVVIEYVFIILVFLK